MMITTVVARTRHAIPYHQGSVLGGTARSVRGIHHHVRSLWGGDGLPHHPRPYNGLPHHPRPSVILPAPPRYDHHWRRVHVGGDRPKLRLVVTRGHCSHHTVLRRWVPVGVTVGRTNGGRGWRGGANTGLHSAVVLQVFDCCVAVIPISPHRVLTICRR